MEDKNKEIVKEMIVTSNEVLQILDIKRSRLSQLIKHGKLTPVKKSLFLLQDIIERKKMQEELRKKFYRPSNLSSNK